jgi:hypothetical protein
MWAYSGPFPDKEGSAHPICVPLVNAVVLAPGPDGVLNFSMTESSRPDLEGQTGVVRSMRL